MPPKKKRKPEFFKEEGKVKRGRKYKKKKFDSVGQFKSEQRGAGYSVVVKENALFEKYYQCQGFIPASEWPVFLATLRESLPATFRITGTRSLANQILACLKKNFFEDLAKLEVDGVKVPPPFPLPWYPGNLAWNVPLTKKFIRKSPLASKFHTFLVRQNEQGNISRQEAVSMIPPLCLDVKPHHKVLDMCAAPGSKTAQLIELLHAEDSDSTPMPGGVVVANDADNKRCYMLVHQAKRLNSPCFIVTNHDASVFPMLYYHDESDTRHPVHYDRVLCDVPCSGDGTLRKNPTIWQSWSPLLGTGLHRLQLRILNRGLELLAPGGRLVYSTCSLNPIENEAVVWTVLSLSKGTVELVDCRSSLEGLITLSGLTTWKVMSKEGEWLKDYGSIPDSFTKQFAPSMFPPDAGTNCNLEKCIRVLPHHQDSGGFFVAVLVKNDWLPWQSMAKTHPSFSRTMEGSPLLASASPDAPLEAEGVAADEEKEHSLETEQHGQNMSKAAESDEKPRVILSPSSIAATARPAAAVLGRPDFKHRGGRGFKEDPYVFFEKDSDFFDPIKLYYGLPEHFPLELFLTRTRTGKKRNIYFCSNLVRELTLRNKRAVKIINIGVKVMSRCDSICHFRLCQEGVDSLLPYIHNHCVPVEQGDLVLLLKESNPLITSLSTWAQDGVQGLGVGPVIFVHVLQQNIQPEETAELEPGSDQGESISITCPLHLSGWLAAKSVRLFLDKSYRYHFLSMLGHDLPTNLSLETMNTSRRNREKVEYKQDGGGMVEGSEGGVAEGSEGGVMEDSEGGVMEDSEGVVTVSEGVEDEESEGDVAFPEGMEVEGDMAIPGEVEDRDREIRAEGDKRLESGKADDKRLESGKADDDKRLESGKADDDKRLESGKADFYSDKPGNMEGNMADIEETKEMEGVKGEVDGEAGVKDGSVTGEA